MRLLHTMLRVGDLQRSIAFYTNVLGMKLLRTSENPEYKYSLAFVGYGPETEEAVEAHWPPLTPEHGFPSHTKPQTQGAPPQLETTKRRRLPRRLL